MDDIRLVEIADEFLVLETAAGEKYRLIIDDELRAATRKVLNVKAISEAMSPREIQEQIRAGVSVAHLAGQTGLSQDLIEKFAAPVLDEIAFVVSSALSIRLSIAGARPNTTEHVEFGEVIAGRLRASGASATNWGAVKLEGAAWRVSVSFALADVPHVAAWIFEPKKLTLAPENDMAIRLSTEEVLANLPASNLRVIAKTEQVAEVPVAAVVAAIENETLEQELEHQVEVESNSTTDLLEAMRRKREAHKSESAPEAVPENSGRATEPASKLASSIPSVSEETVDQNLDDVERDADSPEQGDQASLPDNTDGPQIAKKPTSGEARKARASMPSWDQIVFGSKADD